MPSMTPRMRPCTRRASRTSAGRDRAADRRRTILQARSHTRRPLTKQRQPEAGPKGDTALGCANSPQWLQISTLLLRRGVRRVFHLAKTAGQAPGQQCVGRGCARVHAQGGHTSRTRRQGLPSWAKRHAPVNAPAVMEFQMSSFSRIPSREQSYPE